jgi:hypothetical protein
MLAMVEKIHFMNSNDSKTLMKNGGDGAAFPEIKRHIHARL